MAHEEHMQVDQQGSRDEVSLSIEETNKLRISLGLKPLSLDAPTDGEKTAEDNYAKFREEQQKDRQTRETEEHIARLRTKREVAKKLQGKGLGEASGDEDDAGDAEAWVKRTRDKQRRAAVDKKKQQKLLAEKKAKELEEQDKLAYGSADLEGLRVGHDVDDLLEQGETVLVLKDSTIIDNEAEGDELVNINLMESDKRKKAETDIKKHRYNPYDDDDDSGDPFKKRGVLSKYDEEIDGPTRLGFHLSNQGTVDLSGRETEQEISDALRAKAVALDYEKMQEIKDYYTQEEAVAFKKPQKKKRSKGSKRRQEPDDLFDGLAAADPDGMNLDQDQIRAPEGSYIHSNRNTDLDNVNLVDDDDLQASLSRARRIAVKKIAKLTPEELLQQAAEGEGIGNDDEETAGGIVISETSEFTQNLLAAPIFKSRQPSDTKGEQRDDDEDEQMDVPMDERDAMVEDDQDDRAEQKSGWQDATDVPSETPAATIIEEPDVGSGLAATLALLSQKGLIESVSPDQLVKEERQKHRHKWLQEQKLREKKRELEREQEKQRNRERERDRKSGRVNERQKEEDRYVEQQRERERLREVEERFKDYNPDVKLEYHDAQGRSLNAKEAFRLLSHKFHGKESGKLKTEKRAKKLEEELKLKGMSSVDTPLGTAAALAEHTRLSGSAHVVLSVGNRAAAIPDLAGRAASRTTGPNPGSAAGRSNAFVEASASAPEINREKITFGLGNKRKAESNALGEAETKKPKDD
ncbi:SART-1 protein [Polychytrium aggregatum]|uniref:SART-1 protein n=1 Tax=Polychytrium aggregatum TaxID=110093 RepID=UPI0022FF0B2B|nr:SART-1 protein [Polychytrium aggregatum]KAI9202629.1 SART-1 protein [Polychytrium aggregatum]